MEIIKENVDELNATLKIQVAKEDYEENVTNVLKDYRKKANIPGFRPGKVPFGMISKMYRKPVMVDEINKFVSQSISKYIVDEDIKMLGEPMPSEKEKPDIDWDNQENFEFVFDLGLQPEFELKYSKKDKIPLYAIKVDDGLVDKYIDSYRQRFGSFKSTDIIEEKETVKGNIYQVDQEGNEIEEGLKVEESTMMVDIIKDDEIKSKFIGLKVGDSVIFDIKKAFPNETEITSILKISKEETEQIGGDFKLEIKEITKFEQADVNQDLYDKVYGKDVVKSADEFKEKISGEIKLNLNKESEYKFLIDTKDKLVDKHKFELPIEFLKRWLKVVNKDKLNDEQFEDEFPKFEKDLKWQLIKNKIVKENELKVSEDDIKEEARNYARAQFMQYGMHNVPDDHLENFTSEILKKDEERSRLYEKQYEEKVIELVKETVKIDEKEVTTEEFNKLFENKK